ncbi:MAG: ribosome-binding factor A [Patescibacteria group bacterium]
MPHTPHTKRLEEGGGMQHFRDALAAVLAEYVEFPPGAFVTVLDAKVTRDTTKSKAVISVLPTSMEEAVMERLQEYNHEIKDGLANKLRLRRIPNIFWELDRTEAVAEDVERALNELKKKGEL